ncbi:MAG: hypothetical protein CMK09_09620 [Ponticaulis sp.]|nr:hypothetical protein [Ponticaulis sp.]
MTETQDRSLRAEQLFTTPLVRARHPELDKLVAPVRAGILARRAMDPGLQRSNVGGWHSKNDMRDWGIEGVETLLALTADVVQRHLVVTDQPQSMRLGWGIDMWANVSGPGHLNAQHCHPGAFASAVFYVDMGNGGEPAKDGHLVLEDPRYPMAHMQSPNVLWTGADGQGTASQHAILPEAGELVIFPSWLRHGVKPHSGNGERISVAINLTLQWHPVGAAA